MPEIALAPPLDNAVNVAIWCKMATDSVDGGVKELAAELAFTLNEWQKMVDAWEIIGAKAQRQEKIDTLNRVYRSHKDGVEPDDKYEMIRHSEYKYRDGAAKWMRKQLREVKELQDDLDCTLDDWKGMTLAWEPPSDDVDIPF